MTHPPKLLYILSAFAGVMAMSVFIAYGYFSEVFISSRGSGEIALESALLPVNWKTYHADTWSVGYPADYEVHERSDGAVWFEPTAANAKKTYFLVREEITTLSALKIARHNEGYPDPIDLEVANYPATKYTIGVGRVEYFILYKDRLIEIFSDAPNDETIAIMFATFTMKE
jgi:hypothetical protein